MTDLKKKKGINKAGLKTGGAVLLAAMTSCSAGFQPTSSATACEPPSLGIVWVTGGPIAAGEITDHAERLAAELADGGTIRVLRLDRRVAASADNIDLPELSRCGGLPDADSNIAAKQAAAEELRPGIEDAISIAATTSASLDEGRDILGGIKRMGQHEPTRLELWCTDGCLPRTNRLDVLDTLPPLDDPLALEVPPATSVRIMGAGQIPVADGRTPSIDLVEGIVAEWELACEPLADCEVSPL